MLHSLSTNIVEISSLYEVETTIGEGGQGTVYKAKDKENNTVALKKIVISETELSFINDELLISKKNMHPNILCHFNSYCDGGNVWMVMEYHAYSILDILNRVQLERGDIATMVRDVATGLEYLHELKLIHRDIKADNILISENGVCKIIDFGLSAYLRGADNYRQSLVGTTDFMVSSV